MNTRYLIGAFAVGLVVGVLFMWLSSRATMADPGRMEQLVRDSLDHAEWAEKRDEQRDSMNLVFKMKDDTLSWTREELEYALHHRLPSRLGDDSLLREVRRAVGDLPQ